MTTDDEDFIDAHGYPTEHALEVIQRFRGTPRDMIDFVDSLWWPSGGVTTFEKVDSIPTWDDRPGYRWELSTGGWSGNESIMSELEGTFFWMNFWYSVVRGGHYTFYLESKRIREDRHWGSLLHFVPESREVSGE